MSSSGSAIAISVEGLGKRYWVVSPDALACGRWATLRARLGEYFSGLAADSHGAWFWALRDVSFEVKRGDTLGILGKNGAGKSTLLKILSGVTAPTTGRAVLRGRIGSLLEVGTGFHPDLTGRENIFLSGALLGLRREHIRRKLDEIVDFSGIERFIDTPVKRYSSGMYVRLAYSIASHLDTDILILDEVLAVGDAEFTKKSQASIDKIASEGRTILLVSHNIQAVLNMCRSGMVLADGRIIYSGGARDAVTEYMRRIHHIPDKVEERPALVDLRRALRWDGYTGRVITSVSTHRLDGTPARDFRTGEGMRIRIGFDAGSELSPYFTVFFLNMNGDRVMTLYSTHSREALRIAGRGTVECVVPELRLVSGDYSIMLDFGRTGQSLNSVDCIPDATSVTVTLADYLGETGLAPNQGWIAQKSDWSVLERQPRQ